MSLHVPHQVTGKTKSVPGLVWYRFTSKIDIILR